jgi:hypothetical protein
VTNVRVRPGATVHALVRCPQAQRLATASHALAFYGSTPPPASLVKAVEIKQEIAHGVVRLSVRATHAIGETPTIVQLDLLCVAR